MKRIDGMAGGVFECEFESNSNALYYDSDKHAFVRTDGTQIRANQLDYTAMEEYPYCFEMGEKLVFCQEKVILPYINSLNRPYSLPNNGFDKSSAQSFEKLVKNRHSVGVAIVYQVGLSSSGKPFRGYVLREISPSFCINELREQYDGYYHNYQ